MKKRDIIFDLVLNLCGLSALLYMAYHGYYYFNSPVTFRDLSMAAVAIIVALRSARTK